MSMFGYAASSNQYTALAPALASKGIFYGAALKWTDLVADPGFAELAERELVGGLVVDETSMKWIAIEPTQGTRVFTNADALVTWAKARGLVIRGHTIFDTNRNPNSWLNTVVNSGNWESVLDNHISNLLTHTASGINYATDILDWDVCNEVFVEDDPNGVFSEVGPFYDAAGGPDFIPYCFERARVHNPAAKLVLNCHDIDDNRGTARRNNVITWLTTWLADDAPIDAVGIQSHMRAFHTDAASRIELREFIQDVKGLGLEILVTEFDIVVADLFTGGTTWAWLRDIENFTRDSLNVYADEGITSLTNWGISYGNWWLNGTQTRSGVPFGANPFPAELVRRGMIDAAAPTQWVLASGAWNDGGVWHDSSVWND